MSEINQYRLIGPDDEPELRESPEGYVRLYEDPQQTLAEKDQELAGNGKSRAFEDRAKVRPIG